MLRSKKIIQEKICFQTPLSRIRVHWPEGPKVYGARHEEESDEDTQRAEVCGRQRSITLGIYSKSVAMATHQKDAGEEWMAAFPE